MLLTKRTNTAISFLPAVGGSSTVRRCGRRSKEEARVNIQEAIELYLETLTKEAIAERLSHGVITSSLEIAVA